MSERVKIGTLHITEPYEYTYQGYECAAWWEKSLVHPQSVDVLGDFNSRGLNDYGYELDATIIEDDLQSLYFGRAIGAPYDRKQNAGKPSTVYGGTYGYLLAELLAVKKGKMEHGFIVPEPGLAVTTYRSDNRHHMHELLNPKCAKCGAAIRRSTTEERWEGLDRTNTVATIGRTREYVHVQPQGDACAADEKVYPTKDSWISYTVPGVGYSLHWAADLDAKPETATA